jgi:hypothetical protein
MASMRPAMTRRFVSTSAHRHTGDPVGEFERLGEQRVGVDDARASPHAIASSALIHSPV